MAEVLGAWENKRYLTPLEAVEYGAFGSVRTAAKLRCQRKGPKFIKQGGGQDARIMYERSELDAYIQNFKASSGLRKIFLCG